MSFTLHDQGCIVAPTLLIKYPQVAVVFSGDALYLFTIGIYLIIHGAASLRIGLRVCAVLLKTLWQSQLNYGVIMFIIHFTSRFTSFREN